ncbi:putative serine protease K12H4.7 [Aphelenchoides bicaudatus]|nr:putative serine protease K12H4.7 [Aphelenchoides bicaudatus]
MMYFNHVQLFLFICLFVGVNASQGGFFDQQLDHFNSSSKKFNQLYYINDDFYAKGAPDFLLIAEPGEMHYGHISEKDRPIVQYAKEVKARLWILEHRFYGASQPPVDYTTDTLRFLTIEQSIEDVRQFIEQNSHLYSIQPGNWLVFGVGYSGMLALRVRQKYSTLTFGAILSSPTIFPTLDFYDHFQHCSNVYFKGNAKCHENIRQSFVSLSTFMGSKDGRDQMDQAFQLKPKFSEIQADDQIFQHFYKKLLQNFMIAVENNNINKAPFNRGQLNINVICDLMLKPAFLGVTRLVNVHNHVQKQLNQSVTQLDIDYFAEIKQLRSLGASDERAQQWQTCTQLANFQTTDDNQNMWGSLLPLNYYVNRCTDIFGPNFNVTYTAHSIHNQRDFQSAITNTIVVNGLIDPYSVLSIQQPISSVTVLNLASTAHAADFWPASKQDPVELTKARTQISQTIKTWTLNGRSKERSSKRSNLSVLKQSAKDKIVNWNARVFPDPSDTNSDSGLNSNGWYLIEQNLDHFHSSSQKFNQVCLFNALSITLNAFRALLFHLLIISRADQFSSQFLERLPAMTYTEFTDHTQPGYLAPYFGALLIVLELRFYGASQADDMSIKNLQYLTTEQILADTAIFINKIIKSNNSSLQRALSAYFRSEYPEFTFAAFASSPLMFPKLDFYEYTQSVEQVYKQVGCDNEIRDAFTQIRQLFQTIEGRNQLNQAFSLCSNFTEEWIEDRDRQTFFYLLTSHVSTTVENSVHLKTVSSMCNVMKDKSLSLLQRVNKALGFYICLDWTYASQLARYTNTKYDYKTYGERQYLWQKCTQIGSFSSTDSGYNLYGSVLPIDYHLQLCSDVFGSDFRRSKMESSIAASRAQHGERESFTASNLLIITSSNNPFKSAALEPTSSDDNIKFILNKDNGHCSDTKPPMIDEYNKKLYKKLRAQLSEWLDV